MDLASTKVLVTGGAGFIGSHTVDALIEAGARVVVVDDLSTGRRENLNPAAVFYEVNIADDRFREIVKREAPQVIYHFAFYVLVPRSTQNPLLDLDVVRGTLVMLQAAKDISVRKIVFSSSGFVYGNTPELPAAESLPTDSISPYVVAKVAIEHYLDFYWRVYGLPRVVLRYSAAYGPRQVTGAMADYIRTLARGGQADIWGDGTKTRDYVYVSDVVRANLAALDLSDDHPDPVFNVATGTETTLLDLYSRIASLLGREPRPRFHPDRPGEQLRYCLDCTRAHRELGWKPAVPLDRGLELTVQAATTAPRT